MEQTTHKSNAKDFFLELAAVITLYWTASQVLQLLFSVINKAFPQINSYSIFSNSISFQVASLIVIFPLYIALNVFLERGYEADPYKREFNVRKWLIYLTLFLSALALAGSLISVIYLYLDGAELTTGFLLKVLSWLVVASMIFGYYIQEIRMKLTAPSRKVWAAATALLVLVSIILGFVVIGSPREQRLRKYDEQKVTDIQTIQYRIEDHFNQKGVLPERLSDLQSDYTTLPKDPQYKEDYKYSVKDNEGNNPIKNFKTYELCATFNFDSEVSKEQKAYSYGDYNSWTYKKGNYCFEKSISLNTYAPKTSTGF